MGKKVTVIAKKDGFRRAGIAFSSTNPTVVDLDDLEEEQVKALIEDPMLVVVEGEGAATADLAKDKAENASKEIKALKEALTAAQKETEELKKDLAAAQKETEAAKKEAEAAKKAATTAAKKGATDPEAK